MWNVTINLDCPCTLTDLVLSSNGFQTVLPLDHTVVVQSGNQLQVTADGGTIAPHSNTAFASAWDTFIFIQSSFWPTKLFWIKVLRRFRFTEFMMFLVDSFYMISGYGQKENLNFTCMRF